MEYNPHGPPLPRVFVFLEMVKGVEVNSFELRGCVGPLANWRISNSSQLGYETDATFETLMSFISWHSLEESVAVQCLNVLRSLNFFSHLTLEISRVVVHDKHCREKFTSLAEASA